MRRNIILFILICIAAGLSFLIESFEFILLALIFLSFVFLILAGIRNYFKKISLKYFRVPLIIIIICFTGVLASLFRPYEKAILETGTTSEKLEYVYSTDQKDRKQLRSYVKGFSEIDRRDSIRLNLVKEFYHNNKIVKAIDKFYAAFVFHHSNNREDYKIASKLAMAAAQENDLKDNYQVQWLAKAAYDRWMISMGKEEKYNTQNKFSIDLE